MIDFYVLSASPNISLLISSWKETSVYFSNEISLESDFKYTKSWRGKHYFRHDSLDNISLSYPAQLRLPYNLKWKLQIYFITEQC